jgi:hypothetical protein
METDANKFWWLATPGTAAIFVNIDDVSGGGRRQKSFADGPWLFTEKL